MKPKGDQMEPVVLDAIMLSDSTIREAGTNKLSLIGCFSFFNASVFPFPAPNFFVTPLITNLSGLQKRINLTVRIEDPNSGHVVVSASGKLEVAGEGQEFPRTFICDRSFPIVGVIFPEAGMYKIQILVNSEPIGNREFEVKAISAQA